MFLFAIILAFAWMFDAFVDFNIWLPVLGIMFPLLLLMGADRRIPVILNEPKGVDFESLGARVAWKRFRHLPAGACIDFPGT